MVSGIRRFNENGEHIFRGNCYGWQLPEMVMNAVKDGRTIVVERITLPTILTKQPLYQVFYGRFRQTE